jgi:hypothetical protein
MSEEEAIMIKIRPRAFLFVLFILMGMADGAKWARAQVGDSPGNGLAPKAGDCVITSFLVRRATPASTRLIIETKLMNKTQAKVVGMRLRLLRNHQLFKDWQPIGLNGGGQARTVWEDQMPPEFQTTHYIAELSWGGNSPADANYRVLDTKTAQYRTAGTVYGIRH